MPRSSKRQSRHTGRMHAPDYTSGVATSPPGSYLGKDKKRCGACPNEVKGNGGNPYEGRKA